MKTYILRPRIEYDFPWDKISQFVIQARTAQQARRLAERCCGDEGKNFWTNTTKTSCIVLKTPKLPRVVAKVYN